MAREGFWLGFSARKIMHLAAFILALASPHTPTVSSTARPCSHSPPGSDCWVRRPDRQVQRSCRCLGCRVGTLGSRLPAAVAPASTSKSILLGHLLNPR